jgi:SAM-dependent methyltransferase
MVRRSQRNHPTMVALPDRRTLGSSRVLLDGALLPALGRRDCTPVLEGAGEDSLKFLGRLALSWVFLTIAVGLHTQVSVAADSQRGGHSPGPATSSGPAASSASPGAIPPAPIALQNVQPPAQSRNSTSELIQAYAPYVGALVALIGVLATAFYTLYRGRMDARYSYATEILRFRLRQIQEFYAPALLHIEQSRLVYEKLRWTLQHEKPEVSLDQFRLLDHIYDFKDDPSLQPLIKGILAIGEKLTKLISDKSELIEGGISSTFVDYSAHFDILKAASEQRLTTQQREGWHQFGYYPRLLNREISEGYKIALARLAAYCQAGDQIICTLLKRGPVRIGTYRRQLIENLRFYEQHVREYAAKFDTFDLSQLRQRFVDEIEATRMARPPSLANGSTIILDAGCGTGRDAYDFVKRGYVVTAIDASPAMLRECKRKLAAAQEGALSQEVKEAAQASRALEMTFDEIEFRNLFDGVWAAASLLHVPSQELEDDVRRLSQALKPNGILFMSFKYGRGDHEHDARFYSYHDRMEIRSLLKRVPHTIGMDIWLSGADGKSLAPAKQRRAWLWEIVRRHDRSLWLNVLVRRRPLV